MKKQLLRAAFSPFSRCFLVLAVGSALIGALVGNNNSVGPIAGWICGTSLAFLVISWIVDTRGS